MVVVTNFSIAAFAQTTNPTATLSVTVNVQRCNNITGNSGAVINICPAGITERDVTVRVTRQGLTPVTFTGATQMVTLGSGLFSVNVLSVDNLDRTSFSVIRTGNCDGNIQTTVVNTLQCTLDIFFGRNNVSTQAQAGTNTDQGVSLVPLTGSLITNSVPNTAAAGTSASTPGEANPPVQTCREQTIGNTNTNGGGDNTGGNGPTRPTAGATAFANEAASGNLVMAPSSATYTIRGTTALDKLIRSLNNPNEDFTIQLFADFDAGDPITLSMADPSLVGRILVGTDLQPIKVIQYKVDDIRTDCDFITLIKPNSQNVLTKSAVISPDEKNTHPRASIGKVGQVNQPANQEKLLYGGGGNGDFVIRPNDVNNDINSIVANPPFRPCTGTMGSVQTEQNAALGRYDIRGSAPDLTRLHNIQGDHTLTVRMVSDLILNPQDLAKIVNNNNSLVKISLWLDAGTPSAVAIPFNISEISSHCETVGFTSSPQIN
jgi:hypothetical protein